MILEKLRESRASYSIPESERKALKDKANGVLQESGVFATLHTVETGMSSQDPQAGVITVNREEPHLSEVQFRWDAHTKHNKDELRFVVPEMQSRAVRIIGNANGTVAVEFFSMSLRNHGWMPVERDREFKRTYGASAQPSFEEKIAFAMEHALYAKDPRSGVVEVFSRK
jgi:hypothetical protein